MQQAKNSAAETVSQAQNRASEAMEQVIALGNA